ncbi:hypothetical protein PVAP13_8NG254800 [Panicum virgatum]|uniref:Uncharacterized protein n=1 Tax=Panicum virgatum TaxID=38727 RepID=A0A8T0P705_PANVG|nr:hypothetical protein PVAP13_8NG254800 [Panicum virgatum]
MVRRSHLPTWSAVPPPDCLNQPRLNQHPGTNARRRRRHRLPHLPQHPRPQLPPLEGEGRAKIHGATGSAPSTVRPPPYPLPLDGSHPGATAHQHATRHSDAGVQQQGAALPGAGVHTPPPPLPAPRLSHSPRRRPPSTRSPGIQRSGAGRTSPSGQRPPRRTALGVPAWDGVATGVAMRGRGSRPARRPRLLPENVPQVMPPNRVPITIIDTLPRRRRSASSTSSRRRPRARRPTPSWRTTAMSPTRRSSPRPSRATRGPMSATSAPPPSVAPCCSAGLPARSPPTAAGWPSSCCARAWTPCSAYSTPAETALASARGWCSSPPPSPRSLSSMSRASSPCPAPRCSGPPPGTSRSASGRSAGSPGGLARASRSASTTRRRRRRRRRRSSRAREPEDPALARTLFQPQGARPANAREPGDNPD